MTDGVRIGEDDSLAFGFQQMPADVEGADPGLIASANDKMGIYSILDTASTDILIPGLYYFSFVEKLMAAVFGPDSTAYTLRDATVYSPCQANFPNVYLSVNGYWTQILPTDYVEGLTTGAAECRLRFSQIDSNFMVLGMPWYNGYYIEHSASTGETFVAIAPHTNSDKVSVSASPAVFALSLIHI